MISDKVQKDDSASKDASVFPVAMDDPEKDSVHQGEATALEDDLYKPLKGVEDYDPSQRLLTARSVVVGCILGSLINCGNIYLGLKSGLGLESVLFATLFGYIIITALQKTKLPFLRTHFGPHENNIIQAVASGCVGVGFLFISAIPAMYRLNLLSKHPSTDYGMLLAFTFVSGFFGLSYSVVLRRMFLVSLGRKLQLIFPTGAASALMIRGLHSRNTVDDRPRVSHGTLVPAVAFAVSLVWPVATQYAPGILYEMNFFWYIFKWGAHGAIHAVNWGWFTFLTSPAYLGVGMLMSPRAAASFFLGTILAWGIISPATVKLGYTSGIPISEKYPDLMTFNAMNPNNFLTNPSPRYWLLWPAVFLMLSTSLVKIAMEWRSLFSMAKYGFVSLWASIRRCTHREADDTATARGEDATTDDPDPIPRQDQVRSWEWISLLVVVIAVALPALKLLYYVPIEVNIVNLIMGVCWSLVAIQTYGTANISPVTTVAKASQFVAGGMMRNQGHAMNEAMLANLASAGAAGGAAQAAGMLISDLKTGFLLKTPARAQFYAQAIGTGLSTMLSPAFFILFCEAYPCILDPEALTCSFSTPAVAAWQAVTVGILAPEFPISKSSWVFSIILSIVGIAITVLGRSLETTKHARLAQFLPDMTLVGLAMTTPGTYLAITLAVGTGIVLAWNRISKRSFEAYGYSVAAGAIAGESIAFIVQAIFQIAQIGGPKFYGTMVGCVGDSC
ncbi:hypothetical protein LCI18_003647 [Fusarium solani-melongenae]|uniref:Uncharacterized protein n=1 Tax=Fusarium solani subsp. cucurbitae TaxID=2747967 RepID=A0ACD3YUR5_FUSSC|nr:hypothetical protein LCI18_003647 [Fusarium solani-melongenae]